MGNKRKLVYLFGTFVALMCASLVQAQIPSSFESRYIDYDRPENFSHQRSEPTYRQSPYQHQPDTRYTNRAIGYLDQIPTNRQYGSGSPNVRTAQAPAARTRQTQNAPRRSFGPRPRGFNRIGFRARQDDPFGEDQGTAPFGEAPSEPKSFDPFAPPPQVEEPKKRDPFGEEQFAPQDPMLPEDGGQLSDPFADPPGLAPPPQDNRTREPQPRQPQTGSQGADPVLPRDADPDLDRNPAGNSILEGDNPQGNNRSGDSDTGDGTNDPEGENPFEDPDFDRNTEDRYIPPAGVYRPPGTRRGPSGENYVDPNRQPGYLDQPFNQQPGYPPQYQQAYQPGYPPGYRPAYPPAGQIPYPPAYQPPYQPIPGHATNYPSPNYPNPNYPSPNNQSPNNQSPLTAPTTQQLLAISPPAQQALNAAPPATQANSNNNAYIAAVAPIRPLASRTPNFYFSFFGGWSDVGELVSETGLGQFNLDSGTVFGVALGRRNGRNLRTELEFSTRSNDVSSFFDGSALTQLSGNDIQSYAGMANAYWEFQRFRTTLFQPYIGVGVGFISIDSDIVDSNSLSIVPDEADNDTSLAVQYMAGVNYKAFPNVDLFAEYRFLRADTFRLDTTVGTSDRYNYRSDNVFLGIRWKF